MSMPSLTQQGRNLRRAAWMSLIKDIELLPLVAPDQQLPDTYHQYRLEIKMRIWGAAMFLMLGGDYDDASLVSLIGADQSEPDPKHHDMRQLLRIIHAVEHWVKHYSTDRLPTLDDASARQFCELIRGYRAYNPVEGELAADAEDVLAADERLSKKAAGLARDAPGLTAEAWMKRADDYARHGIPGWLGI
jgi:hypothetical protein